MKKDHYEVEMKFRVDSHDALILAVKAAGGVERAVTPQEDRYLAHPARDFVATGEAFRIRVDGDEVRLTYKGPKLPGPAKTRREIELEIGRGLSTLPDVRELFAALGFQEVAAVRKRRLEFDLQRDGRSLHVALDEVEELGSFAEVETVAIGQDDLPEAQAVVVALAETLGLTRLETRSYLRMLLESRGTL